MTETPQSESSPEARDTKSEQTGSALSHLILGAVYFAIGFIVALLFTQYNPASNLANNQQFINSIVTGVVNQLPNAIVAAEIDALNANTPNEVSVDDDPYLGPEDAPVVMIEFSDYRCPYCARFATTTLESLLEHYDGQLRFVYRDFPVLGNASYEAALATECADDQDAFWPFHDLMFANQQNLSRDTYLAFAEQLELDTDTFQTCLNEATHAAEVSADFEAARAAGASGTPAFFINGQFVNGAQPLEVFTAIIDEELVAIEAQN